MDTTTPTPTAKHASLDLAIKEEQLKQLVAKTVQEKAEAQQAKIGVSSAKAKAFYEWGKSTLILIAMGLAAYATYSSQQSKVEAEENYDNVRTSITEVDKRLKKQHDDTKAVADYVEASGKAVAEAVENVAATPELPVTHDGVTYGCVKNEHGNLICTKVVEVSAKPVKPAVAVLPKPPAIAKHEPVGAPPKRKE